MIDGVTTKSWGPRKQSGEGMGFNESRELSDFHGESAISSKRQDESSDSRLRRISMSV